MTDFPDLLAQLEPEMAGIRGRLQVNFPLKDITWFRVGGPAQVLFQPADEDDLMAFLAMLPQQIPVLPIGLGSNLLIRDGGISGVTIKLSARGFGTATVEDNRIRAGAALPDKRLAQTALKAGLSGFAFYHGIPGSVGGALRMNAGAHGTETKNRLIELTAVDRSGQRHTIPVTDMGYAYRHSAASKDLIFTGAVLAGVSADPDTIAAEMAEVQSHREKAQPIKEKTGGSTFKNPSPQSAWKVIDAAGCRGLEVGGAQMSSMHCNFMINTGAATAFDLETLGETVRHRVHADSGVRLDWEIKRLGRFAEGQAIQTLEATISEGTI